MTAGQLATATGLPRERIAPELSKLVKTGELVKADRGYKTTPASKASPPASSATPTATPNGNPRAAADKSRRGPRSAASSTPRYAPAPDRPRAAATDDVSPGACKAFEPVGEASATDHIARTRRTGVDVDERHVVAVVDRRGLVLLVDLRWEGPRPSAVRGDSGSAAPAMTTIIAAWSHLAGRRTRSQALSFDRRSISGDVLQWIAPYCN